MADFLKELSLSITAQTKGFRKGVKDAQKRLTFFERQTKSFGAAIQRNFVRAGAAFASFFAVGRSFAFLDAQRQAITQSQEMADRIGVSVEALQELQAVAKSTGVTLSSLNTGLQRLARRTSEAAVGTGEAVKAFDELGLNAKELNKLRPDQMLLKIGDSLRGLPKSDQVRLAFKFLDTEGVAFLQFLSKSNDEFKDLLRSARVFGAIVTDKEAEAVARMSAELSRAGLFFEGLGERIVIAFSERNIGSVQRMTDSLEDLSKVLQAMIPVAQLAGEAIGRTFESMLGTTFDNFAKGLRGTVEALERAWNDQRPIWQKMIDPFGTFFELQLPEGFKGAARKAREGEMPEMPKPPSTEMGSTRMQFGQAVNLRRQALDVQNTFGTRTEQNVSDETLHALMEEQNRLLEDLAKGRSGGAVTI